MDQCCHGGGGLQAHNEYTWEAPFAKKRSQWTGNGAQSLSEGTDTQGEVKRSQTPLSPTFHHGETHVRLQIRVAAPCSGETSSMEASGAAWACGNSEGTPFAS